jgi:hypothetical protein
MAERDLLTRVVLAVLLVAAFAVEPRPAFAMPYTQNFSLSILYGGTPVGIVEYAFSREGDQLIVESRLEIDVKADGVEVYKRTEHRREIWRKGTIVSFSNDIEENDRKSQITAVRIGPRIAVTGPNGTAFGPLGTVPATFWSIDNILRNSVFDVLTGEITVAQTIAIMPVTWTLRGKEVRVHQFLMSADLEGSRSRNLFYAADSRWIGMRYLGPDARIVDYRPE